MALECSHTRTALGPASSRLQEDLGSGAVQRLSPVPRDPPPGAAGRGPITPARAAGASPAPASRCGWG